MTGASLYHAAPDTAMNKRGNPAELILTFFKQDWRRLFRPIEILSSYDLHRQSRDRAKTLGTWCLLRGTTRRCYNLPQACFHQCRTTSTHTNAHTFSTSCTRRQPFWETKHEQKRLTKATPVLHQARPFKQRRSASTHLAESVSSLSLYTSSQSANMGARRTLTLPPPPGPPPSGPLPQLPTRCKAVKTKPRVREDPLANWDAVLDLMCWPEEELEDYAMLHLHVANWDMCL